MPLTVRKPPHVSLKSRCCLTTEADGHVADGESMVLVSAVEQWGLHHHMVRPAAPV